MWGHMFFVSSILLGKDAMWHVTKFFEGYHLFGRAMPWLVSCVVAVVIALFIGHALLAVRKFPINYRQYRAFADHKNDMHHGDTTLWWWQVITGFALFFLASVHLYIMLTQPETIGPYGSADRMWTDRMWPLYLVLLFAVELHGGIGLYRLMQKWGWFAGPNPDATRAQAEDRQVGVDGVLPGAGRGHAGGLRQDRHRACPATPASITPQPGLQPAAK
jgi:fumarate reductase subunit C